MERPKGLIGKAAAPTGTISWWISPTADASTTPALSGSILKFSDGSNSKVAMNDCSRPFCPFQQVGKSISQVNFRIGANKDPQATGFSYRISVQGCH